MTPPLAGDTLVEGQHYRPLPIHRDADGLLWGYSEVLDVELCWEAGSLSLRDHATKLFLPTPEDEQQLREEEQSRREAAEERVRQLEAELRRRDGA